MHPRTLVSILAVLALATAAPAHAMVVWMPGTPTSGEDRDGDGIPTHLRIPVTRTWNLTVALDRDDRDAGEPVPRAALRECSNDACVVLDTATHDLYLDVDATPEKDCQHYRLTLCWKWHARADYAVDNQDGPDSEGSTGTILILP